MGLIGVREQSQRFGSIGQGTPFVLADLIEYLVEKGHGLLIVFVGAQDAKRSESTKPPIGGGFHGRRWQTWLFPPMVPAVLRTRSIPQEAYGGQIRGMASRLFRR